MSDNNKGALWLLAGLGIGAAVAILYAPQAGEGTRDYLRSKANDGRDFVQQGQRQVRQKATEWVERGQEVVNEASEGLKSVLETPPESGTPSPETSA